MARRRTFSLIGYVAQVGEKSGRANVGHRDSGRNAHATKPLPPELVQQFIEEARRRLAPLVT